MINNINNISEKFYSDEWFTPEEVVRKMYAIYKPSGVICCPFDTENSWFVKVAKELGYQVIYDIKDFLTNNYEFDWLITNPPFSIKDSVIDKCVQSGKQCVLVLPLDTLGG